MVRKYLLAALVTAAGLAGCRLVPLEPVVTAEYTLLSLSGRPLPALVFATPNDSTWVLEQTLKVLTDTAMMSTHTRTWSAGSTREDSSTARLTYVASGDSVRMSYICDLPGAGTCAPGFVGYVKDRTLYLAPSLIPPVPPVYVFQRSDAGTQ